MAERYGVIMTSKEMRDNPLFMRNDFETVGKWDIPLVKKQKLDLTDIQLVACSDTHANDNEVNKARGVHFFVDDFRFEGIYTNPNEHLTNTLNMLFCSRRISHCIQI